MQLTFDTSQILLSCLGALVLAAGSIGAWVMRSYVSGTSEAIKALEKRLADMETAVAVTKAGFANVEQRLLAQDAVLARIEARIDRAISP